MERRRQFWTVVAVCVLVLALGRAALAQYGGGTGEPNDPYLIYTPQQMNAIGADPNDWDQHFQLMADLDLAQYTGTEFNLIGTEAPVLVPGRQRGASGELVVEYTLIPFTGTFDGAGHTISDFTYVGRDIDRVGLFGYVADPNARIANLELKAPHLYVEDAGAVGALVGQLVEGVITNCCVNEAVILAEAVSHVGALAGNVTGGSVTSCGSNRSAVLSEDGPYGDEWYAGGLVGCLREGTLTECYVDGGVTSGHSGVGGLLGANLLGTVDGCWATLTVKGQVDVGGLVGTNIGIVTNAHATGDVWGDTRVGGLVGYNTGARGRGLGVYAHGEIASCYATGMVIGQEFVGGLVGAGAGPITECFWDVEASGQETSAAGLGLTTAEMMTAAPFLAAGWDFVCEAENGTEDIWYLPEGDYPHLVWELEAAPTCPVEVVELNQRNFDATIAEGVVLVDFYATWCSYCVMQAPILEEVATEVQGQAQVAKLDVDAARSIAQAYNVTGIPTLILFQDGEVIDRFVGLTQAEELVAAIQGAAAD